MTEADDCREETTSGHKKRGRDATISGEFTT